jgi:hypothetical protein
MLRCGFRGVSDVLSAEPRRGQRHCQVVLDAVPSSQILVVTEMYPCSYVLRMAVCLGWWTISRDKATIGTSVALVLYLLF